MKEEQIISVQHEQEAFAKLMKAYMDNTTILTPKEKNSFNILLKADEMLKSLEYKSNEVRAKELSQRCSISLSTARNYLRKAIDFFNAVDCLDTASGARVLIYQIDEFMTLCKSINDMKSAASFMRLKVDVYKELIAKKPIDPKMLTQNNYSFNIGGEMKELGNISREDLMKEVRKWEIPANAKEKILKDVMPLTDYEEVISE